jgi:AP-1-like factor
VLELAKAREADQHENGLLKAQVDRLQVELKDYRKRLSLGASAGRGSPPSAYSNPSKSGSASTNGQNNFQFDFPKFGALPGSQIFPNAPQNGSIHHNGSVNSSQRGSATPPVTNQSPGANVAYTASAQQPVLNRANSSGVGTSPGSLQSNGSNTDSPANSSNFSANNIAPSYNFAPYSTNDNMHGFATTLPQMNGSGNDPFGDLFSPSILKTVGQSGNGYFNPNQQITNTGVNNGGDSTAGIPDNRVFRFNSTSNTSDSASPSASSLSQWNLNGTTNSSCGTSPEPSHGSPLNKDKPNETYDKTNLQNSYTANTSASTNNALTSHSYSNDNFAAFDLGNTNSAFNMPQLESFDPVLFGDYRDNSQDNMFGGADYSGDFFNDALNSTIPLDYSSPANMFGILPPASQPTQQQQSSTTTTPAPSRNLMAEMDKTRDGGDDDYGLPAQYQQQGGPQQQRQQSTATKKDGSGNLISCNNIWYVSESLADQTRKTNVIRRNQLQSNPDFQDGKFDLDGLCSELRAKARCSESGVMVDQDHVDKALKKLGKTAAENAREGLGPPEKEDQAHLMFEQESWDNVLKKLGGGAART